MVSALEEKIMVWERAHQGGDCRWAVQEVPQGTCCLRIIISLPRRSAFSTLKCCQSELLLISVFLGAGHLAGIRSPWEQRWTLSRHLTWVSAPCQTHVRCCRGFEGSWEINGSSNKQVPDFIKFSWKGNAMVQIGDRVSSGLNKWYAWGRGRDPRQMKTKWVGKILRGGCSTWVWSTWELWVGRELQGGCSGQEARAKQKFRGGIW